MKLPTLRNNKIQLIGLLTILLGLWTILYFIPQLFLSFFNTFLGNLILLITVLLVFMNNRIYGITLAVVFIILFRFHQLSEGFVNNRAQSHFTEDSKSQFIKIQETINPHKVFDMNVMENQATQEELDYFNENGVWPWSEKVIELYKDAVNRNSYVRQDPDNATNYARTIYNENAIIRILTYQSKEGQFLLNGVLVKDPSNEVEQLPNGFGSFPYSSGLMEDRTYDVIKCNLKNSNSIPTLERIKYTGKGLFGEQTKEISSVDYTQLDRLLPGFTFLNEPCNPCGSMASNPDYSCAYKLKDKKDNKSSTISNIWKYLWNID